MSSRETILQSIRRNRPATSELPELNHSWTTYTDRRRQFIEVLEAVGGTAIVARDRVELNQQLQRLPQCSSAQKVASLIRGVGAANIDLDAITSPHALAHVDVAILPGEFAVAENAAIWVTDRQVPLRVVYFVCQHLVLVVPADSIVDHMHAAYERIAADQRGRVSFSTDEISTYRNAPVENETRPLSPSGFAKPVFGVFISGPSKTADIEQSLVIGAHGPRSLSVCLLEE